MISIRSMVRTLAASAAVLSMLPAGAQSQARPRTQFGALIGLSSTSITDADLEGVDAGVDADVKRRMGFQLGAYLTRSLSGNVSFQPEIHYIQKGAKIAVSLTDIEGVGSTDAEASVKLAYLEVPLLLRLDMNQGKSVRPFLVAGPAVAFRISCNIGFEFSGASLNTDCADSGNGGLEIESEDPFKKFDAGVMVGGGVAGTMGSLPVSLQIRYSRELINIANDASDGRSPKNTGISLLFGIGF